MFGFRKNIILTSVALLTLVIAGMLSVSCEDRLEQDRSISLTYSEVSAGKSSQFVRIQASGDWTLSVEYLGEPDGWARLSEDSGTGNRSSIILSYDENTAETERALKVVLHSGGKDFFCNMVQKGKTSGGDPGDPGDPVLPETPGAWMELPAKASGLDFYSHSFSMGGRKYRNYSFSWDTDALAAHWVAYPLCDVYLGSQRRTDAWNEDPVLRKLNQPQPIMYRGLGGGYDRGHQIPSADRTCCRDANEQTFYFTNMTPQLSGFNQQVWARLEGKVRSIASGVDTLYVVTGAVVKDSRKKWDDNKGNPVTVPTAYFKALLRYQKSGSTIGYSGYSAAGYYLEHSSSVSSWKPITIDELEQKTGMDFFVNLPARIGKDNAAKVESEQPTSGVWF